MTVPTEIANIKAEKVVNPLSRYRDGTVIYWGELRKMAFETYVRKSYVPTGKEKVMLITAGTEYRPDLVAYDVYGTPDVWWKVMEVNGIFDISDFKAGRTIMLPTEIL